MSITDAERAIFGTSHAEVGAYLLGVWALPDPIVEAAAFHHSPHLCPSDKFTPLTAVHIADSLELAIRPEEAAPYVPRIDMEYLESIGVADQLDSWREICGPFSDEET
jgi:HD-like signal output (HDOD) protein